MSDNQQILITEILDFRERHPHIQEVDLIALDIPGNFFGKRYAISQLEKLVTNGFKLPAAMHLMSTQGFPVDTQGHGTDDGDPDASFELVAGSLKVVSWLATPCAQMLITCSGPLPVMWEPRKVLANLLDTLNKAGIFPVVAFEPGFYLLDKNRTAQDLIQPPLNANSGRRDNSAVLKMERISGFAECLTDITQTCGEQDIKTGPISAELGAGQFEINLDHHNDVLLAADQCAFYRRAIKGVAHKHNYQATFMAKPYLNQAGNGMHLHVSFYDEKGNNLLAQDQQKPLLNAVAGCLELMPQSMLFFASNRNAFRRLESGNATAVSPSWGFENRSVAVRIPQSDEKNLRLEHRVASANANPYLTLAAILAGIYHGLKNKLDPGPATDFDATQANGLPQDIIEAIETTKRDSKLSSYLGADFIKLYCTQKHSELKAFENDISAREYDWYL
jgi:glutamine synthetase